MERVVKIQIALEGVFNLFKTTLLLIGSFVLVTVFILILISFEKTEKSVWCAEYMPETSRSECDTEAGW